MMNHNYKFSLAMSIMSYNGLHFDYGIFTTTLPNDTKHEDFSRMLSSRGTDDASNLFMLIEHIRPHLVFVAYDQFNETVDQVVFNRRLNALGYQHNKATMIYNRDVWLRNDIV